MRVLGFLACVFASVLYVRTTMLWFSLYNNLTPEHNILNLALSLASLVVLVIIWFFGYLTRFEMFDLATDKEEK